MGPRTQVCGLACAEPYCQVPPPRMSPPSRVPPLQHALPSRVPPPRLSPMSRVPPSQHSAESGAAIAARYAELGAAAPTVSVELGAAVAAVVDSLLGSSVTRGSWCHSYPQATAPPIPQLRHLGPDVAREDGGVRPPDRGPPAVRVPACPDPRSTPGNVPPGTWERCTAGRHARSLHCWQARDGLRPTRCR